MAARTGSLHLLMLIFITWRGSTRCCAITVDRPEDLLAVLDPGRFGHVEMTWTSPSSLMNLTNCHLQYQLEYFNTYKNKWQVLRTPQRTYSAQFDLSKDVQVRVFTILNGECTNNTMIKSKDYNEMVLQPPRTGIQDTEAKEFICVYYNMENLECRWRRSVKTPAGAQQTLYFWHKSLKQAVECTSYILSGGVREGCTFMGQSLPAFTDIYFCVNGSSPEGPLKPTFFSLQVQNQVKAPAPDKLSLQTSSDRQLELRWENPAWKLSVQCLEWEVRHHRAGAELIYSKPIHTESPRLTLPLCSSNERNCFKVRSKVSLHCVDHSFWSDWSHEACHPVLKTIEATPEPELNFVSFYIYIAVAIIATLVVSLCVWATINMMKSQPEKTVDSLIAKLLPKKLRPGVSKIFGGKKTCNDVII